ncbi:MAG TPA: OB-fold domain-containing protein [Acidimicrobiales bacterium]|nr:OB-fold domain-containing protein [Acidimicrobiales bacterium]
MTTRTTVPALGAEGWFDPDGEPHLIGVRCATCDTYAFPPRAQWCPNPSCRGTSMEPTPLSRRGRIWSYTDAQYQPPAPFVHDGDEFTPFAIAAVELEAEGLVILGQLTPGVGVDDVAVGDEVEVVTGTLFSDDDHDHLMWRWQPVARSTERGAS